nr:MAG TPA: hypothetical protein [Siphoviridae sp. ct6662]
MPIKTLIVQHQGALKMIFDFIIFSLYNKYIKVNLDI